MISGKKANNVEFDPGDTMKVTRVGSILRKTKLDELPQLFNVLNGDMSLIGPRPEVAKYVSFFHNDFRNVLEIRPGLSDEASIKYRNEENILGSQSDPTKYYTESILPDKLQLARKYTENISLKNDLMIISATIKTIFQPNRK
jgi:lipopolysaccharide/colanic/teichoic acid biosynthesis glycosyltransferase